MNDSAIQIGLPCADQALCYWVGIVFGLLVLSLVIAFVLSAWREHRRERAKKTRSTKRKHLKR